MTTSELKNTHPCVTLTERRQEIRMLEKHPIPDRSYIDYEKYQNEIGTASVKHTISLQATRGCPYNCAYCHKIFSKKHVYRSAKHLLNEIHIYYDMGFKRFVFIDDVFNLNRKNSSNFFELLTKHFHDIHLFFPNGVRGDILTRDYIDLMIEAGTVGLTLALETASSRLQQLIKKQLEIDKLYENIQYIVEKHPQIMIDLFFMHGFPTESKEEALMTLNFVKSIKWLHFPYFHVLKIFPNTDMEKIALMNGISEENILKSFDLAYHELPFTLPFDKKFTLQCQVEFLGYFLSKERLLHVLPRQMMLMSEDEIIKKYNSYLPVKINSFSELLQFAGIKKESISKNDFLKEKNISPYNVNDKTRKYFCKKKYRWNPLKILLIDLSLFFTSKSDHMLYDTVETPLGLMYLISYLDKKYGRKINGKILKSRIDFDSFFDLKKIINDFNPNVIGIRALTFYRKFFHKTVENIREWEVEAPIIAGGPYATSDYVNLLYDYKIDIAVIGEGEITFSDIIGRMIDNGGKLPKEHILDQIPGIAYIKNNRANIYHEEQKKITEERKW